MVLVVGTVKQTLVLLRNWVLNVLVEVVTLVSDVLLRLFVQLKYSVRILMNYVELKAHLRVGFLEFFGHLAPILI